MRANSNLKYQTVPIHLSTVSVNDVNVGYDSVKKTHLLVFPKHGKSIPLNKDTYVTVSLPNLAFMKTFALLARKRYPTGTVNYEYGFTIELIRNQPGVDNDEYYPAMFPFYGVIRGLQPAVSGELAPSDIRAMIYDLVEQANRSESGQKYNLPQLLEVGYQFYVEITWTGEVKLKFGNTELILPETTSSINSLVNNTAGITFMPTYYNSNPKTVYGYFNVPFKVGKPDTATLAYIKEYGIYFKSLTEAWDFNVKYNLGVFDEHKYSYVQFPSVTSALNHKFIVDNNSANITANSNSAVATAISGSGGVDTSVYCVAENTKFTTAYVKDKQMLSYPLINASIVTPVTVPPSATQYLNVTEKTVWKKLSPDKVFKVFANTHHLGAYSHLVRRDVPQNVEYVMVDLLFKGLDYASMHAASGHAEGDQHMVIYVPLTEFVKNVYGAKANLNSALTAGTSNSLSSLMKAITTTSTGFPGANANGSWTEYVANWVTA